MAGVNGKAMGWMWITSDLDWYELTIELAIEWSFNLFKNRLKLEAFKNEFWWTAFLLFGRFYCHELATAPIF
jgi:hypothetical protein